MVEKASGFRPVTGKAFTNLLYNSQYLHGFSSLSLSFNIPLRQTVGLRRLHEDIRQTLPLPFGQNQKKRKDPEGRTKTDGTVNGFDRLPLLACRYRFVREIARGTYSQVILCEDVYSQFCRCVAIKVTNSHYKYIGVQETCRLRGLNKMDGKGQGHIIRLLSTFNLFNCHFCLVLECLQTSLLSISHQVQPRINSIQRAREIVIQMLGSLSFLASHRIIHADLKPENVLVMEAHRGSNIPRDVRFFEQRKGGNYNGPFEVRIADFGNAMDAKDANAYYDDFEVQSLYYRAPEVLMGLPFGSEIDMWSVGCILVELLQGRPLFKVDGRSQLLGQMTSILGPIPRDVFKRSKYYNLYFSADDRPVHPDICRSPGAFPYSRGKAPSMTPKSGLGWLLHSEDVVLLDFLTGLLQYDPKKRLTPQQALRHPFCSPCSPANPPAAWPVQAQNQVCSRELLESTAALRPLLVGSGRSCLKQQNEVDYHSIRTLSNAEPSVRPDVPHWKNAQSDMVPAELAASHLNLNLKQPNLSRQRYRWDQRFVAEDVASNELAAAIPPNDGRIKRRRATGHALVQSVESDIAAMLPPWTSWDCGSTDSACSSASSSVALSTGSGSMPDFRVHLETDDSDRPAQTTSLVHSSSEKQLPFLNPPQACLNPSQTFSATSSRTGAPYLRMNLLPDDSLSATENHLGQSSFFVYQNGISATEYDRPFRNPWPLEASAELPRQSGYAPLQAKPSHRPETTSWPIWVAWGQGAQ